MRHGRFMGYGYNGSAILLIILLIVVITSIVYIREFLRGKGNYPNQKYLDILNERYAKNEISADEYREISVLIEEEKSKDNKISILKEKYCRGEINCEEFIQNRKNILH